MEPSYWVGDDRGRNKRKIHPRSSELSLEHEPKIALQSFGDFVRRMMLCERVFVAGEPEMTVERESV